MILGLPWLKQINATIDFAAGTIQIDPARVNLIPSEMLRAKWFPDRNKFTGRKLKKTTCEEIPDEELENGNKPRPPEEERTPSPTTNPTFEPVGIKIAEPEDGEDDQDVLLAYLQEEPLEQILDPGAIEEHGDKQKIGSALTSDHPRAGTIRFGKGPTIGRIRYISHRAIYSTTQNVWIRAKINPAMALAQNQHAQEKPKTFEEMVPEPYRKYARVFEKAAAERFPSS